MTKIALFDEHVALILSHLYGHFPTPWDCECRMLLNQKPVKSYEINACNDTVEWLENNGFITVKERNDRYFSGVVLSHKGLALLRKTPDSVSGKSTVGEKLTSLVKDGAVGAGADFIGSILTSMAS